MQTEIITEAISAAQVFGWAGQAATIGWLTLIFLPHRIKAIFFVPQYLIPFGLALLYAGLALSRFFVIDGGYNSLAQVKLLLKDELMLLAGWIHYLAFDLFIGAWIAKQSDQLGISRLLQAPILIATFMFGPVGLVIFFCIKAGVKIPPSNEFFSSEDSEPLKKQPLKSRYQEPQHA